MKLRQEPAARPDEARALQERLVGAALPVRVLRQSERAPRGAEEALAA